MREDEWLTSSDPDAMLTALRSFEPSDRKLRLCACACCERIKDDFDEGDDPFDSSRHVVLTTEDETGGPLVWDATTDQLAIFGCDPDGGFGWEPVHKGLRVLLADIVFSAAEFDLCEVGPGLG
jgi:hypothetical protein